MTLVEVPDQEYQIYLPYPPPIFRRVSSHPTCDRGTSLPHSTAPDSHASPIWSSSSRTASTGSSPPSGSYTPVPADKPRAMGFLFLLPAPALPFQQSLPARSHARDKRSPHTDGGRNHPSYSPQPFPIESFLCPSYI